MLTDIGIYVDPTIPDGYIQSSQYGCDPQAWSTPWGTHWIPNRTIKNRKTRLVLEYVELNDKVFEAKIVSGPPDLLNVKTPVDWRVLHKACLTGHNVISTGPLLIEGDFIWKLKGSVKLCFA